MRIRGIGAMTAFRRTLGLDPFPVDFVPNPWSSGDLPLGGVLVKFQIWPPGPRFWLRHFLRGFVVFGPPLGEMLAEIPIRPSDASPLGECWPKSHFGHL